VGDAAPVQAAVARALGVSDAPPHRLGDTSARDPGPRALLLMLDTCGHVLAAGPAVAGPLGACPGLAVLTASRAAPRVRREHRPARGGEGPAATAGTAQMGAARVGGDR
jgi:predicted ATPase